MTSLRGGPNGGVDRGWRGRGLRDLDGCPGLIAEAMIVSMPFGTWTQPLEAASPIVDDVSVPWIAKRASPPSKSV